MAEFPLLRTDAVTQYPSSRSIEFSTVISRFVDGSEQRYPKLRQPVRLWVLRLSEVTPEEIDAISAFFVSRQGQKGSFSFTDPWDGTVYPDCSFEQDEFSTRLDAEGRSSGTAVIRNNQV